jgi:hypothetical protein
MDGGRGTSTRVSGGGVAGAPTGATTGTAGVSRSRERTDTPTDAIGPQAEPTAPGVSGDAPMNLSDPMATGGGQSSRRAAMEGREQAGGGASDAVITESMARAATGGRDERQEQFGDFPIYIGGGQPNTAAARAADTPRRSGGTRLEDVLGDLAGDYTDFVTENVEADAAVGGTGADIPASAIRDPTGRSETARNFAESSVESAAQLFNLPATAAGLKEAGEFLGYGVSETAAGRGGEFVEQTEETAADIGEAAVGFARSNPGEAAGTLTGSVVASAAIMGGASAVSSRAGLASRVAIQPGEEALGYGGRAATKALAGRRAADALFPDSEPLLMSEEAAIRAGQRAVGGARDAASRTRGVLEGEASLSPSPRQSELIERFRPGSATDITGETGAAGARSEPLGSAPEGGLEALYTPDTASPNQGQTVTAGLQSRLGSSEFVSDTRGQLQAPQQRPRSDPITEPEIGDDRVTPNLYQQSVTRQVRETYDALEGGTFEGARRPFAETETGRAATEPEIDTELATEPEVGRRFETALGGATDTMQRPTLDQPALMGEPTGQQQGPDVTTEPTTFVGSGQEITPFETPRLDVEPEPEPEREPLLDPMGGTEPNRKREQEFAFELETRREVELESGPDLSRRDDRDPLGVLGGDRKLVEQDLINPFTGN